MRLKMTMRTMLTRKKKRKRRRKRKLVMMERPKKKPKLTNKVKMSRKTMLKKLIKGKSTTIGSRPLIKTTLSRLTTRPSKRICSFSSILNELTVARIRHGVKTSLKLSKVWLK